MKKNKEQMQVKIKYEDIMTDEFKAEMIYRTLKNNFPHLIVAIIMFIIFKTFILSVGVMSSMNPNILENDIIIYRRTNKNLRRGDIIIFDSPFEPDKKFCKRIVGLPNETIEIIDEKVYINSNLLEEDYTIGTVIEEVDKKIPEDNYYVMGDNRDTSIDSRYFGTVEKNEIRGKLVLRIPTGKIIKKTHSEYD